MKYKAIFLLQSCFFVLFISFSGLANNSNVGYPSITVSKDSVILRNPINVQYLKKHIRKSPPRLILTPQIEKQLKKQLRTNQVLQAMYGTIKSSAQQILKKPLLEYHKIGKRLLGVSRKMLYRMNILGIVYALEEDPRILARINKEIVNVSNFKDWNPSHFLDVAEMSMAISLALAWTEGDLPSSTIKLAKKSLIEKGIKPSYGKNMWWINATNNWNQVCNGGMIAASLVTADINPELAAKTISRSLNGMPHALKVYAPDGVYPEGPTYWVYGTTYSALTASMLETALGTDFGLSHYQPLMESPIFYLLSIAPSGHFYNFFDAGLNRSETGDLTLAWFAQETGNKIYFQRQRFHQNKGHLSRFAGAGLIWASQFVARNTSELKKTELPLVWKGEGPTPVVVFRGGKDNPPHFYLAAKGGRASLSHGNMDAGSFIFELSGVRWVIDPGTQSYHKLEKTGFDLWSSCQTCDRWKLLTKNNFGHSTLTVNDTLFNADGYVSIIDFQKDPQPAVTFDMSALYFGNLTQATRRFAKVDDHSLLIVDKFETTPSTNMLTWQLMTTAEVELVEGGAVLHQDGKQLKVEILSPSDVSFSVISLDPPPERLDKRIKNLKRLELRIPAWIFEDGIGAIKVKLSGSQKK